MDNCILAIISLVVSASASLFAFISMFFARKIENDRKYDIFYKNISGLYEIITDIFVVLGNKKFNASKLLKEAELHLALGAHRLYSYASINKLSLLKSFATINSNDEENNKSFINALFTLETKYYNYRASKQSGALTNKDSAILSNYMSILQKFDDLVIDYSKILLKKHVKKCKVCPYYLRLAKLKTEIERI